MHACVYYMWMYVNLCMSVSLSLSIGPAPAPDFSGCSRTVPTDLPVLILTWCQPLVSLYYLIWHYTCPYFSRCSRTIPTDLPICWIWHDTKPWSCQYRFLYTIGFDMMSALTSTVAYEVLLITRPRHSGDWTNLKLVAGSPEVSNTISRTLESAVRNY